MREPSQKSEKKNGNGKYKFSRFNIIQKTDDGKYLFFNSFSGALGALNSENYRRLCDFINNGDSLDKKLLETLLKGKFIIQKEIDELKEFRVIQWMRRFRTDELNLPILPTMDCNFRCVYCYEDFRKEFMPEYIQDNLIKFVESRGKPINNLLVGWFGGEPLLAFDVIERLSLNFIRLSEEYNFQYSSFMSTNGYLLSKDIAKNLLKLKVKKYQVTFDGLPETHNKRRRHINNIPTFEIILNNLKSMQKLKDDFFILIRIHFDLNNKEEIQNLLEILSYEIHEERFAVHFRPYFGEEGIQNKCGIKWVSDYECSKAILEFYQIALDKGLNIFLATIYPPQFSHCPADFVNHFVIGPKGKIFGCTYELNEENNIGEIKKDGEIEIYEGKRGVWLSKCALDDEICKKCKYLPMCGGGCQLERIFDSNRRSCFHEKLMFNKFLKLIYNNKTKMENIYPKF